MRKILIVCMTVLMITLSGCMSSSPVSKEEIHSIDVPQSNFCEINPRYGKYYYLVDKNTDVVYLVYEAHYRHAITVMLNADGSPITADQLGIVYDKDDGDDK